MIDVYNDMSHPFDINHEYPYDMSATGPSISFADVKKVLWEIMPKSWNSWMGRTAFKCFWLHQTVRLELNPISTYLETQHANNQVVQSGG